MLYPGSYPAWLPIKETVRIAEYVGEPAIVGEYYCKRQVFAPYLEEPSTKETYVAPHILFANADTTPEAVLEFTCNWGPLYPNIRDESMMIEFFPTRHQETSTCFAFTVASWRAWQVKFREALAHITEADTRGMERLTTLLPYRQPGMGFPLTGGAYPWVDFGLTVSDLRPYWKNDDGTPKTGAEIQAIANRLGIFIRRRGGPQFRLCLCACSLMDAFWLMLWFDVANRRHRIRICEKCRQYYIADRTNRMYCSRRCAKNAANLRYYHRAGSGRRT